MTAALAQIDRKDGQVMPQYESEKTLSYDKIKIRLASPDKIREW